jgi:hypothetical protein
VVRSKLSNTGSRPGAEVVQVYIAPVSPPIRRPTKELKEFKKMDIDQCRETLGDTGPSPPLESSRRPTLGTDSPKSVGVRDSFLEEWEICVLSTTSTGGKGVSDRRVSASVRDLSLRVSNVIPFLHGVKTEFRHTSF